MTRDDFIAAWHRHTTQTPDSRLYVDLNGLAAALGL